MVGNLDARLDALGRSEALRTELAALQDRVRSAELKKEQIDDELTAAEEDADVARSHVSELSDLFRQILDRFEMPWFEDAYIDPETYRPVVNGGSLQELMSGGMKVLVNDAYFLAGLTYALQSPQDSLLPTFMIIDTPRKNFGSGQEDRNASVRIYSWIHTVRASYGDRMQVIIADNDVPVAVRSSLRIKSFSYDTPLIPEVAHLGEGAVETLKS